MYRSLITPVLPDHAPQRAAILLTPYVDVQGKQVDERLAEQQVQEMATGMRRLMHAKPAAVTQFLLDCAVELGHKAPTYAMLLGEGRW